MKAVGKPFGFGRAVTVGIGGAKGRIIGAGHNDDNDDFVRTDVSIIPDSSGGPRSNMNGQVAGINTAIAAAGRGTGLAIQINLAKGALTQLHGQGRVTRG